MPHSGGGQQAGAKDKHTKANQGKVDRQKPGKIEGSRFYYIAFVIMVLIFNAHTVKRLGVVDVEPRSLQALVSNEIQSAIARSAHTRKKP